MTVVVGSENRIAFLKDSLIRRGDNGPSVVNLQKLLLNAGYDLGKGGADGDFGPTTERVVRAFQKATGLVDDGIAGPKTLATLRDRKQSAKYLSQADVIAAAKDLGIGISSMLAVNEVESKGTGFLSDGRPVILFERHIMFRELRDYGIDPHRAMAHSPGLVNTKPGGYLGGEKEWQRLENAKRISKEAALESCSWGAFQIMGFHWNLLGFDSIVDYVAYNHISEANQLDCFVRFVKSQKTMHRALQEQNWKRFAELYNGKAHKSYDVKLASAEARYASLIA